MGVRAKNRKRNPFNPNSPIDPHYFAGRSEEIDIIVTALNQTRHGSQQNVLVTGERGIGKSSLAHLARFIGKEPQQRLGTECRFATAYYTLDKGDRISDCCQGVIEKINTEVRQSLTRKFFQKLREMDVSLKLSLPFVGAAELGSKRSGRDNVDPEKMQRQFVRVIEALWDDLSEQGFNSVLLIMDELNKIHDKENLGAFFKKISEELVSDECRNVMIFAVGLPWLEGKIADDDASAVRAFQHVTLGAMLEDEREEIISKALAGCAVTIDAQAQQELSNWSGGFPYFLQQMCFDSFEADTDAHIDIEDVYSGVWKSMKQFERMFFGKVVREVEGKNYQKILESLAQTDEPEGMPQAELQRASGVKGVGQYLPKLKKDGIITSPKDRHYKLVSQAFALYIQIQGRLGRWRKDAETQAAAARDTQKAE